MRAIAACVLMVGCATATSVPPAVPVTREGWTTPAASAPGLEQRRFASDVAGTDVTYHVWLPPGYGDEPTRRYPTLYWLHGSGGGDEGLVPLARLFAGWVAAGELPPLIVVFPNGMPQSMWCDAADGHLPMETVVIRELVPHVDATLRTIATREGRIVEGFSMGGYGAARLGFKYPELFATVSSLGGGPLQRTFTVAPRANEARRKEVLATTYGGDLAVFEAMSPWALAGEHADELRRGSRIRIAVGSRDETLPGNRELHARLEELAIPHEYVEVPGVGHEPIRVLRFDAAGRLAFLRTPLAATSAAGIR